MKTSNNDCGFRNVAELLKYFAVEWICRFCLITSVVLVARFCVIPVQSAVIKDDDPRPWFDRGHHDHFIWSRELGDDYVAVETAYAPRGYKFMVMKSRDEEVLSHGYRRCTLYYDFTGVEPLVVITIKGPKQRHPCLVTKTELSYHAAIAMLEDRNSSTAATSLKPMHVVDGTIPALDERGEYSLFRANPGLRAACKGRDVVDTRRGLGRSDGENIRLRHVLLMDGVVEVLERKPPSRGSSWWHQPFDL